jgi:hypothetical protein
MEREVFLKEVIAMCDRVADLERQLSDARENPMLPAGSTLAAKIVEALKECEWTSLIDTGTAQAIVQEVLEASIPAGASEPCKVCEGSGRYRDSHWQLMCECKACGGTGKAAAVASEHGAEDVLAMQARTIQRLTRDLEEALNCSGDRLKAAPKIEAELSAARQESERLKHDASAKIDELLDTIEEREVCIAEIERLRGAIEAARKAITNCINEKVFQGTVFRHTLDELRAVLEQLSAQPAVPTPCPIHGEAWCSCPRPKPVDQKTIRRTADAILAQVEGHPAIKPWEEWWAGFAGSTYDQQTTAKVAFFGGWRAGICWWKTQPAVPKGTTEPVRSPEVSAGVATSGVSSQDSPGAAAGSTTKGESDGR